MLRRAPLDVRALYVGWLHDGLPGSGVPVSAESTAIPRALRRSVAFVIHGQRRAIAKIAVTSYLGGAAEAVFLIIVTRSAFAITDGAERVGIVAAWYLTVGQTLLLGAGLVSLRVALAAYASWQAARLSTSAVARVRERVASAFLDASWEVQQGQRSGSLQELLTTYTGQVNSLVGSLGSGVVAAANLVALVGIAVAVDPLGALILLISLAVLGVLLRPLRDIVRRRSAAATEANMEFATQISEVSQLGLELHVFHVQDAARRRVGELIEHARDRARRMQFASGLTTPVYVGLAYLALLGALAVVAIAATSTLTSLGAAMLVMLRSLSYGQAAQTALAVIASSAPAMEELQRRLESFERDRRIDEGQSVGSVQRIDATDISFGYVPGEQVLRDVSFTIERREIVGIVGPSGSGKSTLVQLLLGLRDPIKGQIRLDGRVLSSLDKAALARRITFVPQSPRLIRGTIAENIRFFRQRVPQQRIEQAARLAHIHAEIAAFPEGYERHVGELGSHLSGGQQQRLCIARALVEDPDVLIMDEPTSALDVQSEHLIRATLTGLKDRMTVIVIAHRLSTLEICDRIMVIQDGEMRGFDTPAALEQSSDFYREALLLSGMR